MTWRTAAILLLTIPLQLGVTQPPAQKPAQIILFRHAEKPKSPKNPHLSKAGREHAERLVGFMRTNPVVIRFGSPVAIFATKTTKDDNGQRTQETVAPLAKALSLPVQTPFLGKDYAELAKLILGTPAYAGKTVLVCWNHEELPQLASALGVVPEPPKWKDGTFDLVYVITYKAGKAELERLTQ